MLETHDKQNVEIIFVEHLNESLCEKNSVINMCQIVCNNLSRDVRKPDFCICENKDADAGYRETDQRLCFRYIDSTIPLLPIYEISIL